MRQTPILLELREETMALELYDMFGTLGVEVTGIDLAEGVSSNKASLLQAALRDRLVMVIKNQNLSPKQ